MCSSAQDLGPWTRTKQDLDALVADWCCQIMISHCGHDLLAMHSIIVSSCFPAPNTIWEAELGDVSSWKSSLGSWKSGCQSQSLMVNSLGWTPILVGGLVAIFYFPIYWVHIFQRAGPGPPTRICPSLLWWSHDHDHEAVEFFLRQGQARAAIGGAAGLDPQLLWISDLYRFVDHHHPIVGGQSPIFQWTSTHGITQIWYHMLYTTNGVF